MLKTKLLIISVMATVLTGCCLVDHTKTIEKVAEPMLKELQQFYKEHQRYPTTKERDIMLTRSGCQMRGDVCFFEGEELILVNTGETSNGNYNMDIRTYKDKSFKEILANCGFRVFKENYDPLGWSSTGVICSQAKCLNWRQ